MTAADVKKLMAARAKAAGATKESIHAGGMGKPQAINRSNMQPKGTAGLVGEKAKFKADIIASLEAKKRARHSKATTELKALKSKEKEYLETPISERTTGQRFKNVWEVFKAGIPFTTETVVVNNEMIKNKIISEGLQGAANNPLTTALYLTGIIGMGKVIASKIAGRKIVVIVGKESQKQLGKWTVSGTVSEYFANTATQKITKKWLVKAGFTVGAILLIKDAVGTYPFAEFEISETMQTLGMARWKAFEAGNTELMDTLDQLQNEVLNPQGWDYILSKLPWVNVYVAAKDNIKAAEASRKVFNKIIEDEQIAQENGEDDDTKYARIRQEEIDQQKVITDYRLSETKKFKEWEMEAEAAARAAQQAEYAEGREDQRAEDIKARNADAAYWAKQKDLEREKEAADRIAIADFWLAYRIQMQKIADDSRPSNLNFGLL